MFTNRVFQDSSNNLYIKYIKFIFYFEQNININCDINVITVILFYCIQCIDYDFKGLQDPTYYVLLTYVQSPKATMDKILSALQKIERFDIISEIKDNMHNLVSAVSQDAIDG